MKPAAIINQSAADGVIISLSVAGNLKVAGDQTYVEKWLSAICEHKMSIIAFLSVTENDAEQNPTDSAVNRNIHSLLNDFDTDDRRFCAQCVNLRGEVCSIAGPGKLVSARAGYQPMCDVLHRCAGYLPNLRDSDQRIGSERWLGLIVKGNNRANN